VGLLSTNAQLLLEPGSPWPPGRWQRAKREAKWFTSTTRRRLPCLFEQQSTWFSPLLVSHNLSLIDADRVLERTLCVFRFNRSASTSWKTPTSAQSGRHYSVSRSQLGAGLFVNKLTTPLVMSSRLEFGGLMYGPFSLHWCSHKI